LIGRGVVTPVSLSEPQLLRESLERLARTNQDILDKNDFNIRNTRHENVAHYAITDIDVTGGPLVLSKVSFPATYKARFLIATDNIRELTVRLHHPGAPHIHVLHEGDTIESATPFTDMYVSTSPGFLDDTPLRVLTGNVMLSDQGMKRTAFAPNWVIQRGFVGGIAEVGDVFTVAGPVRGVPRRYPVSGSRTAAGEDLLYDNLNGSQFRVYGAVTVRKLSTAADVGAMRILYRDNGAGAILAVFGRWVVPEGGSLIFPFDTGWNKTSQNAELFFAVDTLGPAGNRYDVWAHLEDMDTQIHD